MPGLQIENFLRRHVSEMQLFSIFRAGTQPPVGNKDFPCEIPKGNPVIGCIRVAPIPAASDCTFNEQLIDPSDLQVLTYVTM
jgi:hypothetical protein